MVLWSRFYSLCLLWIYFGVVMSMKPHPKVTGDVKSLLELTPWNWEHLNSSFKVDSPITVDVFLTSHYILTGKHLNKYLKLQKQMDCTSILRAIPNTKGRDGVYTIYPDMKTKNLVYCDMTTDGGAGQEELAALLISIVHGRPTKRDLDKQTVITGWVSDVAHGPLVCFLFLLGNEDIHLLTTRTKNDLRVDVQKFSGEKAYAKYSLFSVASEAEKYKLTVGGYSGTAGDSLNHHNGKKFTTKDQDNDTYDKNCAVMYRSAWWFTDCFQSNLNGLNQKSAVTSWFSIIWYTLGNTNLALKNARMMIRSRG